MNAMLRFLLTIAIFNFFLSISQAANVDLSDVDDIKYITDKTTGLIWIDIDALSENKFKSVLSSTSMMDVSLLKIKIVKEHNNRISEIGEKEFYNKKALTDNSKIKSIVPNYIFSLLTITLLVFIGLKKRKI